MNLEKIQSIQLSLLKRETDPNENNEAEYTIPSDFPRTEEMFEVLMKNMYDDLMKNAPGNADSIGIWIDMDSIIIDNALSLQTLDDIKMYSKDNLNPAYEFFKMTLM